MYLGKTRNRLRGYQRIKNDKRDEGMGDARANWETFLKSVMNVSKKL